MESEETTMARSASKAPFTTIDEAIEEIRRGRMVVVCDDEDRENEGDLVMAAQFATPEAVNFMATHGRGLICLALTAQRCDQLDLNLMAAKNEAPLQTAFTVSIEAAEGVTTGISAHDRARTIQVAIDPGSGPGDLRIPGHIFPLKAKQGGVLERTGHTEASVDLARLAGLNPSGKKNLQVDYGFSNGVFAYGGSTKLLNSQFPPEELAFQEVMNGRKTLPLPPPAPLSSDDREQATLWQTSLKDFVNQQTLKFILGQRPLSQWDAYLSELKAHNSEQYVSLVNKAYQDFKKNHG